MAWETPFTIALGAVAPYYNLLFVAIAIYLFVRLFKTYKPGGKVFLTPWVFIASGLGIFILEEVITILRAVNLVMITKHINGFFELAIVILFIYAVLLQKDYIKHTYAKKPKRTK
ncbi:MAG: hypothetical protein ACE5FT_02835 [Candidatus Nanoarchaeia archaeon]